MLKLEKSLNGYNKAMIKMEIWIECDVQTSISTFCFCIGLISYTITRDSKFSFDSWISYMQYIDF